MDMMTLLMAKAMGGGGNGGASSPKLLGEITLTNENCTKGLGGYLAFNDDLCAKVSALFDAVAKSIGSLFVELSVVTEVETAVWRLPIMRTLIINGGVDFFEWWFCSNIRENDVIDVFTYQLTASDISCEYDNEFLLTDVMNGIPLTIKVYAT